MVALGWKSRGVGVVSAFARGGTCIRILPTPPLVLSRILPRPFRIACFQCVRRPGRARAPSSVRAPPSPGGTVRGRARACLPCLRRPGCARAPLAGGSGARACARLLPCSSRRGRHARPPVQAGLRGDRKSVIVLERACQHTRISHEDPPPTKARSRRVRRRSHPALYICVLTSLDLCVCFHTSRERCC